MNAAEILRREEEMLARQHRGTLVAWSLLFLLIFSGGFYAGVRFASPRHGQSDQTLQLALDQNRDSLRMTRHRADSLAKVDSVESAIATTSRLAATTHRPIVDSAGARVRVSGNVRDSVVVLERPAAGANDSLRVDSLSLPLPIASFIREAKIQLALDATAIHDLTVSNEAKTARILELTVADSLSQHRDSLHTEKERTLEQERDGAFVRGVSAGIKGTVWVAAAVVTVVKIVSIAKH